MKKQTNIKTILYVLLAFIFAISMVFTFYFLEDVGLGSLLSIFSWVTCVIAWLYLMKKNWGIWKLRSKLVITLFIGLSFFIRADEVIADWSRLPWVKAGAFTTVDGFMTDLKEGNYDLVMEKFTPRMQRCVIPVDLSQPNDQLVSWQLSGMNEYSNIQGTAKFSDGQELDLVVRMVWSNNQWWINGFWFGMGSTKKLDYSSMHCGE